MNFGCSYFAVISISIFLTTTFNYAIPAIGRGIIPQYVHRVFTEMEAIFTGFDLAFGGIVFADLVLKIAALQIFVETFITFHSIECFDLSFKNSAGLTDGGGVTRIAVRIVKNGS